MSFRTVCDWQGCDANRERGFLFCREHLSAEINRHVAESELEDELEDGEARG